MNAPALRRIEIDARTLTCHPGELKARLMGAVPQTLDILPACLEELYQVANPCAIAACVPVKRCGESQLDLGFGSFESRQLYKALQSCPRAFVYAATLGAQVDRLLYRLSHLSPARHFITDAAASAMIEAACDQVDTQLQAELLAQTDLASHTNTPATASDHLSAASSDDLVNNRSAYFRPRFSPGYGDLPLALQPDLLNFLNAQRWVGITVGKTLLMSPMKSVTAIMGILI